MSATCGQHASCVNKEAAAAAVASTYAASPHLHPQDGKDEEEEHHHDADIAHGCQAQREALEDELHAGGARQRAQRLDGSQHPKRLQR